MVAIICALFDEAFEILESLTPEKVDGISQYNGSLEGYRVSLFLTKPGLTKKTKLVQWLKQHPFEAIVQTGFAGALHNEFSLGDICEIGEVYKFKAKKKYTLTEHPPALVPKKKAAKAHKIKAHSVCTSPDVAITLDEKEDIRIDSNADLVDMESFLLLDLLDKAQNKLPVSVLKVVGDLPGDELILQNETAMRSYFSTFGAVQKAQIAFKTGASFIPLYRRKRFLQKQLKKGVLKALDQLGKGGTSSHKLIINLLQK